MADAIENVTNDPSSAAKLGRAGYQRAAALFSIEKNVRELCALLNAGRGD
jgi:glycosyltransferase involved in cell wall biosynthesis